MRAVTRPATLALPTLALLLVACAARPDLPPPVSEPEPTAELPVPPGTRIEDVTVPEAAPGVRVALYVPDVPEEISGVPLTVFPTPREAAFEETLVRVEDADIVQVGAPGLRDVLVRHGLDDAFDALPPEGYVLHVTVANRRGRAIVAGRDPAGQEHALRAFRQVSVTAPTGDRLVRECLVVDSPAFPLRGNKRPQAWEAAFGANFAWGANDSVGHSGRSLLPFHAPGAVLDSGPDGVAAALAELRPWQERGVRAFAVKFDDTGFALTPASRLRHGAYPRALAVFVESVLAGLRERDPAAMLYYLPQTYWWSDDRLRPFARAVRLSGGLPRDVGLVMTGPEVISDEIDALGLATSRAAFGLTETKALIYDNLGREGDWGPLTGRDAGLVDQCDSVFGERGTPVNRLTRLDWSWNPWSYEAEASWRRALYELAGPYGYAALRDACTAFRQGVSRAAAERAVDRFATTDLGRWDTPVPQTEIVRLLRSDLARLPAEVSVDGSR